MLLKRHRLYKEHSLIKVIEQDIKYKSVDESEEELERQREDYHYNKLKQIVKVMLADNEDISKIIKYTGLSEKEINEIKQHIEDSDEASKE